MRTISRPATEEYNPYFQQYIDITPEDAFEAMEITLTEAEELFDLIGDEQGKVSYAPGKWTINEVIAHVIDCERIFNYRALSFTRGDLNIAGFDHDMFAKNSGANERSTSALIDELLLVRQATIALFNSFSEEQFNIAGKANNNEITVRALAYLIAGHQRHHFNVIRVKYLV